MGTLGKLEKLYNNYVTAYKNVEEATRDDAIDMKEFENISNEKWKTLNILIGFLTEQAE